MFLSILLLLLGGISLTLSGFPLTYIFFKNSKSISIESLWGISFFVGYAIITSLIKIFLFFNIPIKYSAVPVFFLLIIIFIIFIVIIKKKKQRIMPAKWFLLLLLCVISVSSIGFIISGAENYILYGWWDITNYIQQAEAFKELPYASWNEISYNNPWLLAAQSFFEGWHRISFASFQGFIATISLTDVSKVVGMSGSIGIMLIAMALVYLTDGIKIKLFYRWCAIFFGSTCPIIILAELECFLPVCFFIGMSILSCKIFIELLKSPSFGKTFIVGCLISSYATTLLDGIYIILGLSVVSAICLLFFNKIKVKALLNLFAAYFISVILNFPILDHIITELGSNLSRSELNDIYGFAYTKDALTYSFFNFKASGSSEAIVFIITLLSVILFLAGIFGLVYELISQKQFVLFNGIILLSLPLLFFCQKEELQYAFFKIFQFGFPLIVLGDFLFLQTCVYEFKKIYCVKNTFNVFMKKLVVICMCVSILCFFSLSTYRSIEANYQGSVKGIGNHKFRSFAPNDQLWELWNKLNKQSGKNILFIGRCDNIPNTMSVYFNRKNNVYLLTKEQYADIKRTEKKARLQYQRLTKLRFQTMLNFNFQALITCLMTILKAPNMLQF